jgi:hypothetical protein
VPNLDYSPLPDQSPWRAFARRFGLGRLSYYSWHYPRAAFARSRRAGGPWNQWLDSRGEAAMRRAAAQLPPRSVTAHCSAEAWFLTGRRFWHQTAFCAWSLLKHSEDNIRPGFIDDGSFDDALVAESQRLFPGSLVRRAADCESQLDAVLPTSRFPVLRAQRRTYIHLRKLTDAHIGHRGWRLVLDSDMLFFRRPDTLLEWLAAPDRPIHMLDVHDAYGYPAATLAEIAGRPIPSCVNVGICGLRSEELDWQRLEHYAAQLLARHGTSYYLEQALVALLLAGKDALRLPREDYRLLPSLAECQRPTAVLHHYVAESKRGYFRYAWKQVSGTAHHH